MRKLSVSKLACMAVLFCAATVISSVAQVTFTTLAKFSGGNGAYPAAVLIQGTNGNFYGTTQLGASGCGSSGCGTVFKVTTAGTLTRLHSFAVTDGENPTAGLIQGSQGNFYGTTFGGGAHGSGTVFRMTQGGALTSLYSFCPQTGCTDGSFPAAGLIQTASGNFYGTTLYGGTYLGGTVFRITPAGTLTTLYSFCAQSGCVDGSNPAAGLIQATDGNLYGTTKYGGAYGNGAVFRITAGGALTTLYSFCPLAGCSDGSLPVAGLVQGSQGNLYGTTSGGGNGSGTVFRITTGGTLTTLFSFCPQKNCINGSSPDGGLVLGTDGKFYGTTSGGGANNVGTVFRITAEGTLTKLHSFNGTDGKFPIAGVVQGTDGKFYGTTSEGGSGCGTTGCGTIFSLDVGLGPFIETQPTSGKVGTAVTIRGTNLTGATDVSFNGTPATFTVVSGSEITTTVPSGASTGTVTVSTPSGVLKSNVAFRVTQ